MEAANLRIDNAIIERIVQAEVQAKVAEALNHYPTLIADMVSAALSYKVKGNGQRSNYDSENTFTYLQAFVRMAIQQAAKEALTEYIAENKEALKKEVSKQLRKAAQTDAIAGVFVEQLSESIKTSWRFTARITLPGQENN